MQIKTFEAFSMREAVAAIRSEFGSDAVILNSKEKADAKSGSKIYEVTAAIASSGATAAQGMDMALGKDLHSFKNRLADIESKVDQLLASQIKRQHFYTLDSSLEELKSILFEVLKDDVAVDGKDVDESILKVLNHLKVMEIDPTKIAEASAYLCSVPKSEKDVLAEDRYKYYRDYAIRWMIKRIKIAPSFTSSLSGAAVHVFVGSNGVGKTSIVSKLAQELSKTEKKEVLLISMDTKRLAANEHLRIFSKLIGVRFEEARTKEELETLLSNHQCDVVLVDTYGLSPKNQKEFEPLQALKKLNMPLDFHLVLSTTESSLHQDRTVRFFSALGLQSLIFNKLDESWCYGSIFNLSTKWAVPLSYFGVGPSIPEDVERASRERVIERIFGVS
jgi:flagellar biosynthesis protein FlhF